MKKKVVDSFEANEVIELIRDVMDMERSGELSFTPPPDWYYRKHQYRCEVCWTCKFFNILDNKCSFTNKNGLSPIELTKKIDPDLKFEPNLFRCENWKDGER
jgi:hypothetical protein